MALLTKNRKKTLIVANDNYLNRFEKSCGTFRGGGGKNPMFSMTLG
jgi:hypothetical protein